MATPFLNSDGFAGHTLIAPNRLISWRDAICKRLTKTLKTIL